MLRVRRITILVHNPTLTYLLTYPVLPENYMYKMCRKRLTSLLKRLRQEPQVLLEYDAVIRDQIEKGIVEKSMNHPLVKSERFTTCLIMLSSEETKRRQNSELSIMCPASQTESL